MRPQWRGLIEEYRDLIDLLPEGLEAVTLREGGTPLVQSEWLSSLTGAQVWLKVEGDNPTGSFKDRGMTTAISVAKHEGAQAVVCASTGNTSASMAAYAAKATEPLTMFLTWGPDRYSAPPVETWTIPSLPASAKPWSAAFSVWEELTLIAG